MTDSSKAALSNPSQKPFRVLSIDGGGVRGLMPLKILNEIEVRTGQPISQLFDLIVGNSTGGIIALCLAALGDDNKPKYTAQDAWNLYYTDLPKIFEKSIFRSVSTGWGLWAPKYNRSSLDGILQEFFGNLRLSQVVTHVVATSYSLTKDNLSLWTSYRARKNSDLNILMSDIAGATSAAPTYFAPKTITFPSGKTINEVDGGIYANDPEAIAVTEALVQNPGLKPEDIFILSLGTGQPKLKQAGQKLSNTGIVGWLTQVNLIDLMMNADTQLQEFEVQSFSMLQKYRIQLTLGEQNSAMDNAKLENLQSLTQISENYIKKSQNEISQICEFLTLNRAFYSK